MTVKRRYSRADKKKMREQLSHLYEPSLGGGINPSYADGYYAKSLEREWLMTIEEMVETSGYKRR